MKQDAPLEPMSCTADLMQQNRALLNGQSAFVGFDGFVDEMVRVISHRDRSGGVSFFNAIDAFAHRISEASGISADIELVTEQVRFGGNAPIMSHAIALLGIDTHCVGAMGYPGMQEVFAPLLQTCHVCSICKPGVTTALEFDDGKIMLAKLESLQSLTWDRVKQTFGLENLYNTIASCRLVAFVNWSLISGMGEVWKGMMKEVCCHLPEDPARMFFFDLADPSKRAAGDIVDILDFLGRCKIVGTTTLGLNENEAHVVAGALGLDSGLDSTESLANGIFQCLDIDVLLVHPLDSCVIATRQGITTLYGKRVQKPVVTTGGGDNFNAGYCMGRMLGLDARDAACAGMAASGYYVAHGRSAEFDDLIRVMRPMPAPSRTGP